MQEQSPATSDVSEIINSLKIKVALERDFYIKKRIQENTQKLVHIAKVLHESSTERRNLQILAPDGSVDQLSKRQKDAIDMQNGIDAPSHMENGCNSPKEDGYASAILLGSSIAVKNAVRPIKIPEAKRLPPYTTWIFLDRNQRMTEDQSVVGRRRIYYDENGGETLICSDSDEEVIEEDEEKRDFAESENYILRMAVKEAGLSDTVVELLAQCLSRKPCEVKARYEDLMKEDFSAMNDNTQGTANLYLDKDLDAAMDSFDNLFCRRCLVFDCRLHGCSQDLIYSAEKPPLSLGADADKEPCGSNCFRGMPKPECNSKMTSSHQCEENIILSSEGGTGELPLKKNVEKISKSSHSESASTVKRSSESSDSEIRPTSDATSGNCSASPSKRKESKHRSNKRNSKRIAEKVIAAIRKRQKKSAASEHDSVVSGNLGSKSLSHPSPKDNENICSSAQEEQFHNSRKPRRKASPLLEANESSHCEAIVSTQNEAVSDRLVTNDLVQKADELVNENILKKEVNGDKSWRPIEKSLFEKGLEIFGRSSCLIARNLLNGQRTCLEVFQYMNRTKNKLSTQAGDGVDCMLESGSKSDEIVGSEARRRSRFLRRRGRVRRLKYTWKSAGYHAIRKRISEKKDEPCRQYNPCGCQSPCGKECPCIVNGTCCEKYCGCTKTCKNRFRGCHCAKSQCRSRQCPCFAAGRECDPDVCRNCWIGCGDGSLGIPLQRGDNYECRNMKLLLKQQQRILLGRSDVSGWGAFIKNSVSKHEYLGEYTGELISHREADKRGKIYDRENSSFLFNLNNQFVLDAFRKGDKLKFANHSPNPNCYAKVLMVAGDHRVGIFANERICAGEELFYDYRYDPDRAPAWAKKPEAGSTSKRDDAPTPSHGRARKHT
ncbi:unnamed protein product [Cuscuta campestris]|uniref:[histone H3]-lysine(27) N-trimethyltransferase n=1 Tax=Cuscuta campestris TaxID=132261 RepID=A0A484K4R5_9ASTE|nr:unnamed protein product [Cuscuta campestris]